MNSYSFATKTPSESFKLLIQGEIRKVYVSSLFICPQQRGDSSPHSELSLVSLTPDRAQPTVGHKKPRGVQPRGSCWWCPPLITHRRKQCDNCHSEARETMKDSFFLRRDRSRIEIDTVFCHEANRFWHLAECHAGQLLKMALAHINMPLQQPENRQGVRAS